MSSVAEQEAPPQGATGSGLELRELTKDFGGFVAVDSLDLLVPKGAFFALAQIPMYTLPALLAPAYRRALGRSADGSGGT